MQTLEDQVNQFVSPTDIMFHGENLLARMQSLVNALGNPEKSLKIFHIAGTSGKTIIMDGSHSPQKLTALANYLGHNHPAASRILVATLGENKHAALDESMTILRTISDRIILTSFQNESLETNKRTSISSDLLQAAARHAKFTSLTYQNNPKKALQQAMTTPATQVIITGSFYLLNHLRPALL